tara:strand:+ start:576 stop:1325 length:750 start_codon:yes stop_codon:yes gene_type:complete
MKKLFLYMVLSLLWCNQSFVLSETIEDNNLITDEEIFENATPLELYSGHSKKDKSGYYDYYSTKKKEYITCKEFQNEGIGIKNPEAGKYNDDGAYLFSGGMPFCHGDIMKNEDGVNLFYDVKSGEFVPRSKFKRFLNSEMLKVPSDNLNGKKVYCVSSWDKDLIGFEFKRGNKVKVYGYEEGIWIESYGNYEPRAEEIFIKFKYKNKNITIEINRKTLKISQDQCYLYKENLRKKIKDAYDAKKIGNKI